MTTPKRRLLEHLLPEVRADVAARLNAGESWRQIAQAISEVSGVTVSHETMRNWYGQDAAA